MVTKRHRNVPLIELFGFGTQAKILFFVFLTVYKFQRQLPERHTQVNAQQAGDYRCRRRRRLCVTVAGKLQKYQYFPLVNETKKNIM